MEKLMTEIVATNETILVVGGGISGMTAALEAAETGKNVVLVEKNPSLGGRTSQLYRYFPKLCHPTCGLEINLRRLKGNPRVRVLTLAEVTGISGSTGNYSDASQSNYWAQPNVTFSTSGTRILFNSDWGDGNPSNPTLNPNAQIDTYVLILPSFV